ncbi:hypothetical protein BaRGS_00000424 [Batillaria attramentaria]|uniref:Uncharacterized protein n=1 Tax=Batillaria attramentaria TaxID=370345 RepID=A0ABD0M9Q6_9CAEN
MTLTRPSPHRHQAVWVSLSPTHDADKGITQNLAPDTVYTPSQLDGVSSLNRVNRFPLAGTHKRGGVLALRFPGQYELRAAINA